MGNLPQIGCILTLLCAVSIVNSYSKYGRGCSDIGCLPNEMCVMAQDSCNLGQRDGKDCGTYPTCKRGAGGQTNSGGASLNPAPENTRFSSSSNPSQNSNNANTYNNQYPQQVNPNNVFGAPQSQQPFANVPIFPHHQPTSQPPFQQFPQPSNPLYPQYPQYPAYAPKNPQNPYGPPIIFGHPPHPFYNPQPTTREPSLIHQFLYNKQDRRRNSSGRTTSGFIVPILGLITIILHQMT